MRKSTPRWSYLEVNFVAILISSCLYLSATLEVAFIINNKDNINITALVTVTDCYSC